MTGGQSRDFSQRGETRTPDKTTVELVSLGGGQNGRYTFPPGGRWSERIKPVDVDRTAPGHDAWVTGHEPAVVVEFQGAASDAKPS